MIRDPTKRIVSEPPLNRHLPSAVLLNIPQTHQPSQPDYPVPIRFLSRAVTTTMRSSVPPTAGAARHKAADQVGLHTLVVGEDTLAEEARRMAAEVDQPSRYMALASPSHLKTYPPTQ